MSGRNTSEFTQDRDKLEAAVKKLNAQETPERVNCPYVTYYLADLILKKGDQQEHEGVVEYTMSCAHVTKDVAEIMAWGPEQRELIIAKDDYLIALRAVRRAIEKLAVMPGQRLIVFASPGFFAQSPEAIRQTTDVLNLAVKAHVVISGLDPKGVFVGEPDASDAIASTLWPRYLRQSAEANGDVVADLANGTGGIFFRDNNDLAAGFDRTAVAPQFSYMLGFTPTAFKPDGRFHLLKIRLANGKRLSREARRGYYALPPDTEEQAARADIDDKVFSVSQINDIPIVSKINGADHAKVMVVAK